MIFGCFSFITQPFHVVKNLEKAPLAIVQIRLEYCFFYGEEWPFSYYKEGEIGFDLPLG